MGRIKDRLFDIYESLLDEGLSEEEASRLAYEVFQDQVYDLVDKE